MSRTSSTSHAKGLGLMLIFFALVIVGVVLFVLRPDMTQQGEVFPVRYWVVMAGTAVPLLVIGVLLVGRGLRVDQTYKTGLAGEATVVSSNQAAFGIGSGDDMDTRVTPIMKLVLRVTVPGHAPYEAKVNEIAPGVRRFQMQPGATLPVRVDPKKLSRVVVDWDRSTAATIGQLGALGVGRCPGSSSARCRTGRCRVDAGAVAVARSDGARRCCRSCRTPVPRRQTRYGPPSVRSVCPGRPPSMPSSRPAPVAMAG